MKCYFCSKNEADSVEHIIPNALGGKIKGKILCKDCNNKLGYELDSELTKQLLSLSNLLNHSRDNGLIPDLECFCNDIKVNRKSDGQIFGISRKVNKTKENNDFSITTKFIISNNNDVETIIQKETDRIINDLAKKHKKDFNEIKSKTTCSIESDLIINNPIINSDFGTIGGEKCFLSVLKIALNFYIYKNHDISHVKNAINILKNKNYKDCINFYNSTFYPEYSIYHCIVLIGDRSQNILYCLISLFGYFDSIILLNDNYTGEDFKDEYLYNLRNDEEEVLNSNIELKKQDILDLINKNLDQVILDSISKKLNEFSLFFTPISSKALISNSISILKELKNESGFLKKEKFIEIFCNRLEKKYIFAPTNFKMAEFINIIKINACDTIYNEYIESKLTGHLAMCFFSNFISLNLKTYENQTKDIFIKECIRNFCIVNFPIKEVDDFIKNNNYIENNKEAFTKLFSDFYDAISPSVKIFQENMQVLKQNLDNNNQ